MTESKGPYKLITVGNNPGRARDLYHRALEELKDKYNIIHVANAESKHTLFPLTLIPLILMLVRPRTSLPPYRGHHPRHRLHSLNVETRAELQGLCRSEESQS